MDFGHTKTSYDSFGNKTGSYYTRGDITVVYDKYGNKKCYYKRTPFGTLKYDMQGKIIAKF